MASIPNFIELKILFDKENIRLLFAEADSKFLDTLLSFFTFSFGNIVNLVGTAQSLPVTMGCFNSLYESVKNLDTDCFCTDQCKDMLLNPKSLLEGDRRRLKVNIDVTAPTKYFRCSLGYKHCNGLMSMYKGTLCNQCSFSCKDEVTSFKASSSNRGSRAHEVFVLNTARFIISDDLHIMPSGKVVELLNNLSIQDMDVIEERTVKLGLNEFLELLKWMFLSRTPLTDMFVLKRKLPDRFTPEALQRPLQKKHYSLNQAEQEQVLKMKIKVTMKKSNKEVLFAEAQQDFIDFLFSFLTIPLGQMLHVLEGQSCLGSIDSLYKSVQALESKHFISEDHKNMILRPKVFPHFNCKSQLFPVEADSGLYMNGKKIGFLNPKLLKDCNRNETEKLGDYLREALVFMVLDNLIVTPYSAGSAISILNRERIQLCDVEERTITLGIAEGKSILRASLNSKSALTNGLFHKLNIKEPKQEV